MTTVELLTQVIKLNACNREPMKGPVKELREGLVKERQYTTLASDPDVKLWVKNHRYIRWGRKIKTLGFQHQGRFIPITKKSLRGPVTCRKCGNTKCSKRAVLGLFREAIDDQIKAYKKDWSNRFTKLCEGNAGERAQAQSMLKCPLSGVSLMSTASHVDHVVPFSRLVDQFLALYDLDLCKIKCNSKRIYDPDVVPNWQQYHEQHAQLQLVSAKANLKKGNKTL
jgi:hypothetical protein